MRATLLLFVTHAFALAPSGAAGGLRHAEVLPSSEDEESQCCVSKVTDLQLDLTELRAENIASRKANERLVGELAAVSTGTFEYVNADLGSPREELDPTENPQLARQLKVARGRSTDVFLLQSELDEARAKIKYLAKALEEERTRNLPKRDQVVLPSSPTPRDIGAVVPPFLLLGGHGRRSTGCSDQLDPTPAPTTSPHPTSSFVPSFSPTTSFDPTSYPTVAPSVSLVPTSSGVTTHAQLSARVADNTTEVIIVTDDVIWPSQAPIFVEAGRSVSILGRSALDGGHVSLDGAGHSRLFYVKGGTLNLATLNLANASVPPFQSSPDGHGFGGIIHLSSDWPGNRLTVRSCYFYGGGRGVSRINDYNLGGAYMGGAICIFGAGATAEVHNSTFSNFAASIGAAIAMGAGSKDNPASAGFYGCLFVDNQAVVYLGAVYIAWDYAGANFYDCEWLRNLRGALITHDNSVRRTCNIVRCVFRENTGSDSAWPDVGGVVVVGGGNDVSIVDTRFESNEADPTMVGGALSVIGASSATLQNVSFHSNLGNTGATVTAASGSVVTMVNCEAIASTATGTWGAGLYVEDASTVVVVNSSFAQTSSDYSNFRFSGGSNLVAVNSFFRDNVGREGEAGFNIFSKSTASLTDCLVINTVAHVTYGGAFHVQEGAVVTLLRTTIENSSAATVGGCMNVIGGSTLTTEDSDIINCHAGTNGGMANVAGGGTLNIKATRISASSADGFGSVAYVESGSTLRVVDSILSDSSGNFAIFDETDDVFAVQFDNIDVDETVDIYSSGNVLIQNSQGFRLGAVDNASVGACASITDHCPSDSW